MEIWQSQHVEPLMMSMDEIRSKAVRFEGQIRMRDGRETTVAVVMIVVFGLFLYVFPSPMERAGSLLTIAGMVFVIYRMNRQAAPENVPAGGGSKAAWPFTGGNWSGSATCCDLSGCGIWVRWCRG